MANVGFDQLSTAQLLGLIVAVHGSAMGQWAEEKMAELGEEALEGFVKWLKSSPGLEDRWNELYNPLP